MNILFVVATDLSDNNSAVMCHSAYIRGMVDAGHDVDVLTAEAIARKINGRVDGASYYEYSDENLFVKLVRRRRKDAVMSENHFGGTKTSEAYHQIGIIKSTIYKTALKYVGAVPTLKRRMLKYQNSKQYDLLISLASPATSHEIAAELLRAGNVVAKHSCQIWEDPWASDLYGGFDEALLKREKRVLSLAEKVMYVTPITLQNQKKLFPDNADKMTWLPLPIYMEEEVEYEEHAKKTYGYFGQYYPHVRNLEPFYEALRRTGRSGIFCGDPSNLFDSTERIEINPRLSLEELSIKEKMTDVLVCVANLGGGQIPGKIYQYSASIKPVLFILDGSEDEQQAIREYFSKFDRYVFAKNDVEDIVQAMDAIEDDWKLYDRVMYFSAENIAREIIRVTCK